ncbi:hypothetical protein [Pseudanabaena sp. ABRG5-3]|uniref:hypothetical protein n=1 Tax=Pseudanabaena sp. ABRG5-3 TaxID=685565 RepID=UPI000DC72A96|nr:hypothetical protein [Pseudanabaena sp. ABRG5-3]BBC22887.1 hypothetical protein ABRG53_0630 [Pseudanabaena sp. ABRG5-3]
MKHKETPKTPIPYLSISSLIYCIIFLFLNIELWIKLISIPIVVLMFFVEIKYSYKYSYKKTIAHAYRWSIREALRTQYPDGIVYVLENVLQELNKFNITKQPYKVHRSFENGSSDYYGFPNQSNLSATIVKAKYLCEEWSKLDQIQQIQFMEGLWNQIREEDMWLDDKEIKLNKSQMAQDIYWYSYEESDHKKMSAQIRDTKDLRNSSINRSNNNIDESVW